MWVRFPPGTFSVVLLGITLKRTCVSLVRLIRAPAHQRSRAFPSIRLGSRRTYSRRERLPNEQAGDREQSQNLISRASKPIKSRCAFRDRSLWRFLQWRELD